MGRQTICYCPTCGGWGIRLVNPSDPFKSECPDCRGEGIVQCTVADEYPAPRPAAEEGQN